MKKLLTILFILIAYLSTAQVYTPMTAAGYQYKRIKADSTLHIPSFCGTPTLRSVTAIKQAAIAFDSCNSVFYVYDPKTATWGALVPGGSFVWDSAAVYQTINDLRSYIYDTAFTSQFMPNGVKVDTVYDVSDSMSNIRRFVFSDNRFYPPLITTWDDTLKLTLNQTNITQIQNIVNYIDSAFNIPDTTFHIVIDPVNSGFSVTVAHDPLSDNDTLYYELKKSSPTQGGYMPKEAWALFNNGQNGIISGGRVTWLTGYTYNVSEAYYRIDSVIYHSPSTDITLDAAHATLDRIDLFLLTTSNTAVKLSGTAGSGIPPDFDANLYLEASFALVTANTTSPPGVVSNFIYRENTEWTTAVSGVSINANSTNNPYAGSKDVEGTAVANSAYITFTSPAGLNMGLYNTLTFQIRSKANFQNTKKLVLRWFQFPNVATGNNVPVGSGSYGFVSTNTSSYQTVTIPLSDFGNISAATILRITQSNTSGTGGWYIDNIQLQNITGQATGKTVIFYGKNATRDSTILNLSDGTHFAAKDSIGTSGGGGGLQHVVAGYGLTNVNDSTLKVDSSLLLTKLLATSLYATIPNLALKLNISDTANIRLRPIAGTNMTITGTYPNLTFNSSGGGGGGIDSVRKAANSDSIKQYTAGTGTFAVRTQRVFNVKDYGAVGDGVTNDQTAIQAAVDAANTFGAGGKIFFPKGVYVVSGALDGSCNCQIKIPVISSVQNRATFILEGETVNLSTYGGGLSFGAALLPPTSGSIIKSTITTYSAGSAVIGTATGGGFQGLIISQLGIQVKNNPTGTGPVIGGINWKNGGNFRFKDVQVFIDTSGFRSTLPLNDVSGIETTNDGVGESYYLENCFVGGFRSGFKIGEHVNMINCNVMTCYYGILTKFGTHSATGLRTGIYWCPYDIYVLGALPLSNFKFDAEWQQIGKWYDDIATVKDSANLAKGQLFYTITEAGVGVNNTKFSKSGGANLYASADANGVLDHSYHPAIGETITSATAGSIFYAGTAGVLQQSNSNLFYDLTNVAMGLGTATPNTNGIEIKKANPILSLNTTGATGNAVFLMSKNGTLKWGINMDGSNLGKADFNIYDYKNNKTRIYADTSGVLNLGGTADVNTTAAISIADTKNVTLTENATINKNATISGNGTVDSVFGGTSSGGTLSLFSTSHATKGKILFGTSAYEEVNNRLGLGTASPGFPLDISTSSTDPINIVSSNAVRGTINFQTTNAASQTTIYVQNNRGAFASYGGWLYGGSTNSVGNLFGVSRADRLFIFADGANNAGMAMGTLNSTAFIMGTNATAAITISSAQAVRMHSYGAGTATFDASGNITSVSDERLKTNIRPYKTGLKELMNLNPITYKWNKKSGNEMNGTYAGFSAQNVQANIPFGTGENKDGYLSLQDRAILGAAVNAIKELNEKIIRLEAEIKALKK